MKDFHLCGWLLSYDLSKISIKLVISLKYNIGFAKFFEILLGNNITASHTHIHLLKALSHQNVFKDAPKNSTRLGFR